MTGKQSVFEEKTVKTEPIFRGKIISLQVDTVELPDGRTATREIVRHSGAVGIMALHEGKLLVVEQYRKALGRSLVEIPAGMLERGEKPEEAAKRELEEETGYRCKSVIPLSSFYTSPGFADEILHLFWAEGIEKGMANPDEDEFLNCRAVTFEEAGRLVADGSIRDAKTIAAFYIWQIWRETGRIPHA